MRCDLHVHTFYSGMCDLPLLSRVCRESYSPPEAVYERLKTLGMDLVTVTDHDSIQAAEVLGRHADFLLGEEVTCQMPSGTQVHVGVYDIDEHQHAEIQRRRRDLPSLVAYLEEERIFFCANHAFSALTGRRELGDFLWLERAFAAFETLNGHALAHNNLQASRLASETRKVAVGGSDAHALSSLGSAFTEVPGARNKSEFLEGLRQGRGRVWGNSGSYWRLTRDVLLICAAMIEESPAKWLLAPLAIGVPVVTFVNYVREARFGRKWERDFSGARSWASRLGARRAQPDSERAWA